MDQRGPYRHRCACHGNDNPRSSREFDDVADVIPAINVLRLETRGDADADLAIRDGIAVQHYRRDVIEVERGARRIAMAAHQRI